MEGLLGIINSKSIWASHSDYLNDSSEYRHALDFAKSYAINTFTYDDYLSGFSKVLVKALRNMNDSDIFISSFSEVPDLLSQWRGYCPKGEGICVGFRKEILEEFCKDEKLIFEKCIYSHKEQQDKILLLMDKTLGKFPKPILTRKEYEKLSTQKQVEFEMESYQNLTEGQGKIKSDKALKKLCNSLEEMAPYMKNEAFEEEAEWRIIAKNPNDQLSFRPSKSHLIPYIILPILKYSNEVISEIIIGPNANETRCSSSIKLLVESQGLKNISIKKSKIPLNSW